MNNDAFYLRRMTELHGRPAKVLAITSGKGGVGKTNISANLAICLAASRQKVLLIDADLSLGNLDVIMNINSNYNISHTISGRMSIKDVIHIGPEGLEIIFGGSGLDKLADINEFQQQRLLWELSKIKHDTDIILIDTAAGISRSVIRFCLTADHVLVVTTPEATAMTNAYSMIKVLVKNRFAGQISVVVNMAKTIKEGKRTYRQIANVARQFLYTQVYEAGVLLRDERLTSAVQIRKPVVLSYPKSTIASSLMALAAKLGNGPVAESSDDKLFRKVANWIF